MRKCLIILLLLNLASCQSGGIRSTIMRQQIDEELSSIELEQPNSKYITEVYLGLERLLIGQHLLSTEKKYHLKVSIYFNYNPLLISKNSDLLRENITAIVNYELRMLEPKTLGGLKLANQATELNSRKITRDLKPNNIIHKGRLILKNSHDVIDAPFATYIETEQMSINLAEQAAESIYKRLFIFFHNYLTKHENISKKN